MRIAFYDHSSFRNKPGQGGMSNTIWNLGNQLSKLGEDVTIFGSYKSNKYPYKNIKVIQIDSPDWMNRNIVFKSFILLKIWKQLTIGNYDIVHLRDYYDSGVLSTLPLTPPIAITVPGNVYQREALGLKYFDPITKTIYKISARLTAKRCAHVIATSQEMRDWWIFIGVNPLRISTIPLGVDTNLFKPIQNAQNIIGFDREKFHLLYVGRLSSNIKQIPFLLETTSILTKNISNVELHFVGRGEHENEIKQITIDKGLEKFVKFHGWIYHDKLPLYYSASDICILTSASEPFGRVMLEAMACETPFLGPKMGGMADHIDNGKNGYLAKMNTPEELAKQLNELLSENNLLTIIGKNGREYINENLTWENIAGKVRNEVYTNII